LAAAGSLAPASKRAGPANVRAGKLKGGRGEGLEVFSRHGIGAGHRAHRGVPMVGRRPARRRARQETGDLYSGHKAVVKDVSYAPRQQVAAWVACTGCVAAEYGDVASGHDASDTWGEEMGHGWRCGARSGVHGARTGGPRPASVGPSGAVARTPRDAGAGARSRAPSVPNNFDLACFD
jgi:hypothetical protein